MSLAEKLVYLRKQKGLTQMELAERLNVSRQAISRWEVGAAIPSTDNLKFLGDIYEVPVDYFLNDEIEDISKKNKELDETTSHEQEKKGVFLNRRMVCILLAVILMLLAYIISTVIVPNQNKEDIVPMENMTTLEGDNFSEMVLPIE